MAVDCTGKWFLDSIDLWTGFQTAILKGTTDFLKYAPKKDGIEYNWPDQHGLDIDLSTPKFSARDISLQCAIFCDDTDEFLDNYNALINQLMSSGFHSFVIATHGLDRSYSVEYRNMSTLSALKPLTVEGDTYNVHLFTLNLREPEPNPTATTSRITDETGRYIVS